MSWKISHLKHVQLRLTATKGCAQEFVYDTHRWMYSVQKYGGAGEEEDLVEDTYGWRHVGERQLESLPSDMTDIH